MHLIVKTLTGKTIALQVKHTDSVDATSSSNSNDARELALVTHMRGGNLSLSNLHSHAHTCTDPTAATPCIKPLMGPVAMVADAVASLQSFQSEDFPLDPPSLAVPQISTPMRIQKKTRCNLPGCSDKIIKIVGECRYCTRGFCGKHRLPESHDCSNLHTVRQASLDRLAGRLLGEKCVPSKV
ncbi:hypothetical protein BSLG_006337 [Batrachochytrium salamandrivorans]|nr:hypothetical protein BSLG_006337 [Batrachochytrium salamandrivorans]